MEDQGSGKGTGAQAGRVADPLHEVYERLLAHYGPQGWWPAESRFEIIVGAILVQAVGWPNIGMDLAIPLDPQTRSGPAP